MSDAAPELVAPPQPRWRWWTIVLVVSLALNLLVGGAVVTSFFMHERMQRFGGISNVQLIPRRFLGDLPRERRAELLAVFRGHEGRIKAERQASRDAAINLAAALEAEPYDEAKVRAVAESFGATGNRVIAQGIEAAIELISKLSPVERKLLAEHIRKRGEGGRGK